MLSIPLPELTSAGLKLLSKALRSPPSDNAQESAAQALWALVRGRSRVHLVARDCLAPALSQVTWMTGACGNGKTELALHTAFLASHQPDLCILFVTTDRGVANRMLGLGFITAETAKAARRLDRVVFLATGLEKSPTQHLSAYLEALSIARTVKNKRVFLVFDDFLSDTDTAVSEVAPSLEEIRKSEDKQILVIQQFCDRGLMLRAGDESRDDFIPLSSWSHYPNCTFYRGKKSVEFFRPQKLVDADAANEVLSDYGQQLSNNYKELHLRLSDWFECGQVPSKHYEALEAAARLLGFSSWHSAEGYLKKSPKKTLNKEVVSPQFAALFTE